MLIYFGKLERVNPIWNIVSLFYRFRSTNVWIILSQNLNNDKGFGFGINYTIYTLIYIYILTYYLLAHLKKNKYFVYFNPFTWIFIWVSPPVFMVIQCWMKNPNSDIEELKKAGVIDFKSEDSDDSNFDDHGLEGFADMKDDKDEKHFWGRLHQKLIYVSSYLLYKIYNTFFAVQIIELDTLLHCCQPFLFY